MNTNQTIASQEIQRLHKSPWFVNQFKNGEYNEEITDEMRENGCFYTLYDFKDGSAAVINHDGDCYEV